MSEADQLIPEINDEDIDEVCSLMGLDFLDAPRRAFLKSTSTVDVSACPGSGKTTLVVAKLAILAKKWAYRSRGICVLSHTNVAREQIECRLGNTVVGQRLLSYPHFVDTIHGFANRFLSLPWLKSNGYPSPTIDNDVTTAYRRKVVGNNDYRSVHSFLKWKHLGFDKLRICSRNLEFNVSGRPYPAKPSSRTFEIARRAVEVTAQAGYFCHEEMFVWAQALLDDHPALPKWMAHRFPLIILDEMQDTSERQVTFLDRIFPRKSSGLVVQRVGDPNQAIFDFSLQSGDNGSSFPDLDESTSLTIPNSFRFGPEIAALASPLAVEPVGVGGLCGIGPRGGRAAVEPCGHTIFVFQDDNTDGVLDAYGRHALRVLGPDLATSGPVAAVAHIHQPDSQVLPGHRHYPKSLTHYWDGYSAEVAPKNPHPRTLVQYIQVAQGLVASGRVLSPGVEKLAAGILELARRIGDLGDLKRKARTHRTLLTGLDDKPSARRAYTNLLNLYLIDKVCPVEADWLSHCDRFGDIAASLCDGEIEIRNADRFLSWPDADVSLTVNDGSTPTGSGLNTYRVTDGAHKVDIQLGTVHSVKGQTHAATLLLSTNWQGGHSSQRIMPWLCGKRINGTCAGVQDTQRLRNSYVAMTRPRHLLCLAVPRLALGGETKFDEHIVNLQSRGWLVAEIVDGNAQWSP